MLVKQCYSKKLKLADVTPVYKKKNPDFLDNYRLFSVLPGVSKSVEELLKTKFVVYIKKVSDHNMLLYHSMKCLKCPLTWKNM